MSGGVFFFFLPRERGLVTSPGVCVVLTTAYTLGGRTGQDRRASCGRCASLYVAEAFRGGEVGRSG